MRTSRLICIPIAALAVSNCIGQLQLDWAHAAPGPHGEEGQGTAVDQFGNTLVIGSFLTTIDLDPDAVGGELSTNQEAAFVARYDPSGDLSIAFAVHASQAIYPTSISFIGNGGFLVAGTFAGLGRFDPDDPNAFVSGAGFGDAFIAATIN
ncbi:MAG: hypothetical protein IPI55_15585 [Flavobacteriales bacterium]|nr:hypothetical protein [Flavobacteriales bacterium]